jgi:protein-serine/threonine kinase
MSDPEPQTPSRRYRGNNALARDPVEADWTATDAALNERSAKQNADTPPVSFSTSNATPIFISNTAASSPPPHLSTPPDGTLTLSPLDTSSLFHTLLDNPGGHSSPLSAGLRIRTDVPGYTVTAASAIDTARTSGEFSRAAPKAVGIARTPSFKNVLATSVGSSTNLGSAPSSVVSSPMLNAMTDVTPLPSPLMSGDSPGPWRKLASRCASREAMIPVTADAALITANGESISSAVANQSKRRAYHGLGIKDAGSPSSVIDRETNVEGHTRNRSLSDYAPEAIPAAMPRSITVSGSQRTPIYDPTPQSDASLDMHMRREPHLAVQRGLAPIPR